MTAETRPSQDFEDLYFAGRLAVVAHVENGYGKYHILTLDLGTQDPTKKDQLLEKRMVKVRINSNFQSDPQIGDIVEIYKSQFQRIGIRQGVWEKFNPNSQTVTDTTIRGVFRNWAAVQRLLASNGHK